MRAGQLRHRVTLQTPTAARDAVGGDAAGWTALATVWASVEPLTARELLAAGQVEQSVTHRVRMRYRTGITARVRVLHEGRVLSVRGVRDIGERHVEIELLCEEGPSDGR